MRQRILLIALGLCVFSSAARAEDWPQWRGPQRNGISRETGLLQQWPAGGPRLVWQARDLGSGHSTPAVVGDRAYILSNEGLQNEYVIALDAADGNDVWRHRIGKVGKPDQRPSYPGARSTPTIDGELLYALGSDGDLVCMQRADGEVRWQKNLLSDFGGSSGTWAYAESPLVDGEQLICTPGGETATILALNKRNGDVIWQCPVPGSDAAGYASIIIHRLNGLKQYVQFLGGGLVGVEAETGRFLWRYDRTAEGSAANIPTPVIHEDLVYSGAGQAGGGLVKLTLDGQNVAAEQVYYAANMPKGVGGFVKVGDYIYGSNNGNMLLCVELASGDVQWQNRSIGNASFCYADGRLYLHGENGEVALVEPSPQEYRERGRFTPPNQPDRQGRAWAHPVVANGRLYIRDADTLWCYDISAR